MKIAVAGKGGTGKTTAVTLLATYLAKDSKVLAFDVDTNENLAYSLDFSESEIKKMDKIRNHMDEIFEHTITEKDWKKRKYVSHKNAKNYIFGESEISNFIKKITLNRKNIYVGHLGNIDEEKRGIESMCDSFTLMRIFLNHLVIDAKSHLLVDLAAGNDLITRSTIMNMDTILLVVEPTSKNLTVAKDILISLKKLYFKNVTVLINKSFDEKDVDLVSKFLSIKKSSIVRIPFSQEILKFDNENKLQFDNISEEYRANIIYLASILERNRKIDNLFAVASSLDERVKTYEI